MRLHRPCCGNIARIPKPPPLLGSYAVLRLHGGPFAPPLGGLPSHSDPCPSECRFVPRPGSILAALMLGYAETIVAYTISSGWTEIISVLATLLMLIFRPAGMFGKRAAF